MLVPALAVGYFLAARRFPADRRRTACFAAGLLLILAAFVTPLPHALNALPALCAPAPERRSRRVGAGALRARPTARAGRRGRQETHRQVPDAPVRVPPTLDRHVLRLARPCRLRRGTPAPVEPDPRRARVLLRDRLPLLVAGASERAASAHPRQPRDLPVCGFRARQPARPAARADPDERSTTSTSMRLVSGASPR